MSRQLAIACSLLCSLTVGPALPPALAAATQRSSVPGSATLYASGIRGTATAASSKLDGTLAELARNAWRAKSSTATADLRALSPAAQFRAVGTGKTPVVAIDAITRGDPQALKSALVALGLRDAAVFRNDVGGWLPVDQILNAAARSEVVSMRAAMPRRRSTVATQGDYVQGSSTLRGDDPTITGSGIMVGVLSDSFDCYATYATSNGKVPASGAEGYAYNGFTATYATDVSTGALPTGVDVIEEAPCLEYQYYDSEDQPLALPFTDEGRAMLQIVHAVAPGASLAFHTGSISEADFANGVVALKNAGALVIADDIGYFDEPFFQDGLIAQAINTVEANGASYFSAAGNDQDTPSYQNTAPSFGTQSSTVSKELLLNFDTTGATVTTELPVTIPPLVPGEFVAVAVEWDQPYVTGSPGSPGASSQINLCLTAASGSDVLTNYDGDVTSCSGVNAIGADPYQVMIIANPATGSDSTPKETLDIQIGLVGGTTVPGRIILAVEDDGLGSTINKFSPNGPTLQGHPGAAGAAAVGAAFYFDTPACGTTPATLEPYSSAGGAPILFDTSGDRLATAVYRQKPDFVGPDGVNNTFLGFTLASDSSFPSNGMLNTSNSECQNDPSYPNFFGTSAATPHAAGIAALLLQAQSGTTPATLYQALRASALAMSSTSPNYQSGYGFIQAQAALTQLQSTSSGSSSSTGSTTSSSTTSTTTTTSGSGSSSGGGGALNGLSLLVLVAFALTRRRPTGHMGHARDVRYDGDL